MGELSLREKIRLRVGLNEQPAAEPQPQLAFDDDLIPVVGEPTFERTEEDADIDRVLGGIDLVDAYKRWCRKMEPKVGKKRESIMISCPNPAHPDKTPSAWINLDKGTWFCGGCQEGGDAFDIAAWHFGYDVPGYKTDGSFPELRRDMAEDLGYVVKRTPSGATYLEERPSPALPEASPETAGQTAGSGQEKDTTRPNVSPALVSSSQPDSTQNVVETVDPTKEQQPESPVLTLVTPTVPAEKIDPPTIDWRHLVPADTFLSKWMRVTSADDLPEEYYFWLGLVALGFAAGNDVLLMDRPPVKGNLFICLYGPSGIGKTRSTHGLTQLLAQAMPFDHETAGGTYLTPSPGSAEALVDSFSKQDLDPITNAPTGVYKPVRGLVRFDELSNLIGKANRNGSTLKPTLMEFYDSYQPIEMKSRGAGYVRADGHFCSALTTTQPGAIRDLLMQSDADSGFINRWVFASGPIKPLIDYGRAPLNVEQLVDPLRRAHEWCATGRELSLEGEARDVWRHFFDKTLAPIRTSDDATLLTRCDLLLKKIILLFSVNEQEAKPTADIVRRVVELFPYLKTTYSMLVSEIGIGQFEDCREQLGRTIRSIEQRTGAPAPIRDINATMSRRYPRDLLAKVLGVMVSLGEVNEDVSPGKRGPKTVRYSYCA